MGTMFSFFLFAEKTSKHILFATLPETSRKALENRKSQKETSANQPFFQVLCWLEGGELFLAPSAIYIYIHTLCLSAGRICRLFCCGNRLRASNKSLDRSTKGQGSTHSMRILLLQRIPPPSRNTGLSKGLSTTSCLSAKPY